MNINFNQIDKNFVWTLEKDKILAVQKKLDDHQTLDAFNEIVGKICFCLHNYFICNVG